MNAFFFGVRVRSYQSKLVVSGR